MGNLRKPSGELVQGTLDMLILKTLARGALHGYGIAQFIQQISDEVLRVEEGSLYPALHRLELNGFIDSEWANRATSAEPNTIASQLWAAGSCLRRRVTGAALRPRSRG